MGVQIPRTPLQAKRGVRMKVLLDVSFRELDALEDLVTVWTLCKKHNVRYPITENQRWNFTQTCKKCIKLNKEIRNKSLHLWSKLMTAYLKSSDNRIRNSKRKN